jgi:hypothetical protein
MVISTEIMSQERLYRYIREAAQSAAYEEGFGIKGCDLSQRKCGAVYARQSLREQAENDRLGEYFLTCAKLAKQAGVIIPEEYIIYDNSTSEHLERPGMIRLRSELIAKRLISSVFIPTLGRLSMDDHHRQTFEKECQYYGVNFFYGDAPNGMDIGSQFARAGLSLGNLVRVKTNRDSALAGNIGRILAGKVPSQRAPHGYNYRREAEIDQRGRTRILKAWWEIDEIRGDNELVWGSPAWVVCHIFIWIGREGRTQYWVTAELNKLHGEWPQLFKPLYGERWFPKMISEIVARESYTGQAYYNKTHRVPNPNKPLGDLTMQIKRTLTRPKPESDRVAFEVPALTTHELWESANKALRERGRGRGKQGKKIQALCRGRIICPICGKTMAVMRRRNGRIYYYCRSRYCKWLEDPCPYSSFVPGTWDEEIWQEICELLKNDLWVEQQLTAELDNSREIDKLIRLQERKINNYQSKIKKVEEGFEGGLFTLKEAKLRKQKSLEAINTAQAEIDTLKKQTGNSFTLNDVEKLRLELRNLQDRNMSEASFEERLDLVARLGIKVYPTEDLKSRRIKCGLDIRGIQKSGEQDGFAKVVYGRPCRSRTCDTLIKSQVLCQLS